AVQTTGIMATPLSVGGTRRQVTSPFHCLHPPTFAAGGAARGGPAVHLSESTSYFHTSSVTGPGCFPLNPPANQTLVPSMAGLRRVTRVGMSSFRAQESLAGS